MTLRLTGSSRFPSWYVLACRTPLGSGPSALWPTRSVRLASLVDGDGLGEQHLGRAPACVPGELGSAGHALRADAAFV